MMNSEQRAALILQLIEEQAPALFSVHGTVYEGRVDRCLRGELTAVVRPYGTREDYRVWTWPLDEIDDFGAALMPGEEDEDPLMQQARDLVKRAQEHDELSLAERLVAERIPRGENA